MNAPMRILLLPVLLSCAALTEAGERSLAARYQQAFRIGFATNSAIDAGNDGRARAIVLEHANSVTAENVLKAGPLTRGRDSYDFTDADRYVDFATRHGLFVVGHTLVWHNQTPDWFFEDEGGRALAADAQLEQMRKHIEAVAGRYAGRVDAWDVVNEVIGEDGAYRPTRWVTAVGDGDILVKAAFRYANQYAPDAELYYNDFNAWRPAKRDGIVRLVNMLKAEGIRIDGVGMQGHWGLDYPGRDDIEAAIDAFAASGVKVMVTELDVDVLPLTRVGQIIGQAFMHPQFQLPEFKRFLDPYPAGLPADLAAALRQRYGELFEIFYGRRDKIDRVTLWGVHDGMSWKNGYPIPDRTNYPLLWDREYQPKAALEAVLAVPNR